MDIEKLVSFSLLASYLNYTSTAERLYISQSALSKQIQSLERELNVRLFVRNKHLVALTREGEECLRIVSPMIAGYQQLKEWSEEQQQKKLPTLNVGYYGLVMRNIMLTVMETLWQRYPDVDILLKHLSINTVVNSLNSGALDVAFLRREYCRSLSDVCQERVYSATYRLLVSARHPLAGSALVRLPELRDEHFVSFNSALFPQTYEKMLAFCRKYGLEPHITDNCDDPTSFFMMVRSGRCVGLAYTCSSISTMSDIQQVELDCQPEDRISDILAVWKKDNPKQTIPCLIRAVRDSREKLDKEEHLQLTDF